MYQYEIVLQYTIQNTKDQPIALRILEAIGHVQNELGVLSTQPSDLPPSWTVGNKTTLPIKLEAETDLNTIAHRVDLPAREGETAPKKTYLLHLVFDHAF